MLPGLDGTSGVCRSEVSLCRMTYNTFTYYTYRLVCSFEDTAAGSRHCDRISKSLSGTLTFNHRVTNCNISTGYILHFLNFDYTIFIFFFKVIYIVIYLNTAVGSFEAIAVMVSMWEGGGVMNLREMSILIDQQILKFCHYQTFPFEDNAFGPCSVI